MLEYRKKLADEVWIHILVRNKVVQQFYTEIHVFYQDEILSLYPNLHMLNKVFPMFHIDLLYILPTLCSLTKQPLVSVDISYSSMSLTAFLLLYSVAIILWNLLLSKPLQTLGNPIKSYKTAKLNNSNKSCICIRKKHILMIIELHITFVLFCFFIFFSLDVNNHFGKTIL